VGSAFDGTSRLGEALAQTNKWCTEDFKLMLRLVFFGTAKVHVNSDQLAALITTTNTQRLQISLHNQVCFSRDSETVQRRGSWRSRT
jgi:hypothetical protein